MGFPCKGRAPQSRGWSYVGCISLVPSKVPGTQRVLKEGPRDFRPHCEVNVLVAREKTPSGVKGQDRPCITCFVTCFCNTAHTCPEWPVLWEDPGCLTSPLSDMPQFSHRPSMPISMWEKLPRSEFIYSALSFPSAHSPLRSHVAPVGPSPRPLSAATFCSHPPSQPPLALNPDLSGTDQAPNLLKQVAVRA